MNNKLVIILFSLVMLIAYVDLVDSFKYFETLMSQMIKLDSEIRTEIDTNNFSKIQK